MKKLIFILSILYSLSNQAQNYKVWIDHNDTLFVLPDSLKYYFFDGLNTPFTSLPDGKWLQMENNNTKYTFTLKNNLLQGDWMELDSNNNLKQKGYYLNGRKNGPFYTYSNNGIIVSIYYFYFGSTPEVCFYYDNGLLKKRFLIISDSLHFHSYYFKNGMKESEGCIATGEMDENGVIIQTEIGIWNYWHQNGVLRKQCYFHYEIDNSVCNYYNQNGEFIKSEYYKMGELIKSSDKFMFNETGSIKGQMNK